jgi:hypothetical protein
MAGWKGMHTKEGLEKLRKFHIGRKLSIEIRKKIGIAQIGNKYRKGKKTTEEVKRRISESGKKRYKKIGHAGHWNWKGGKNITSNGYIDIYKKDHPFSDSRGYVKEHRLVMEQKIGRYLRPDEIVHHLNRKKDDNRIENLYIVSRKEHNKYEIEKLTCPHCKFIIDVYVG